MPARSLGDLLFDPFMEIATLFLLSPIWRSLQTRHDRVAFVALAVNRGVTVLDTLMVLLIDNYASNGLIYFSLVRSLVRHAAYFAALAYITYRRLDQITSLVLRENAARAGFFFLGITVVSMVLGQAVLVAYFAAGIIFKSTGDAYLAAHPRATVGELNRATLAATPVVPAKLWQLVAAVVLPLIHALHLACDAFIYRVAAGLWSTTFLNVRKLTTARWIELAWPSVVSLVLHGNFVILTIAGRTVLDRYSLGFVVELGQAATVFDWFVFFTVTAPLMQDVVVEAVPVPAPSSAAAGGDLKIPAISLVTSPTTANIPPSPGTQQPKVEYRARYTKHFAPPIPTYQRQYSTPTTATVEIAAPDTSLSQRRGLAPLHLNNPDHRPLTMSSVLPSTPSTAYTAFQRSELVPAHESSPGLSSPIRDEWGYYHAPAPLSTQQQPPRHLPVAPARSPVPSPSRERERWSPPRSPSHERSPVPSPSHERWTPAAAPRSPAASHSSSFRHGDSQAPSVATSLSVPHRSASAHQHHQHVPPRLSPVASTPSGSWTPEGGRSPVVEANPNSVVRRWERLQEDRAFEVAMARRGQGRLE
ncbi:hypothetical protein H9P43_002798 [Blastocladiella emersonii ATCC 22665]|nr:hypothetical protein H9P43_002798 [Blastocladiella emersonii ATCC 22665]